MPPITPFLDTTRFDTLSEGVVLRRIGELLATALVRSGRLLPRPDAKVGATLPIARTTVNPWDMVSDPIERQLVRFLHHAGPTAPRDLASALGIARRSVARKLRRLRINGLCEVVGKTKAARYQLRTDQGRN
jgi:CRP-like cAMP-binding protein